jgi:hypothetical protein
MVAPFPPEGTLLVLSVGGVPLYSARDLEQTLEPIKASRSYRRTINGVLVDLSVTKFHKYESKIRCSDVEAPALDGVMPGMTLTVDCVAELVFKTAGGAPSRTVVPGSTRTVGAYTIYRPRLTMMVTQLDQRLAEYDHETRWTLELEEV